VHQLPQVQLLAVRYNEPVVLMVAADHDQGPHHTWASLLSTTRQSSLALGYHEHHLLQNCFVSCLRGAAVPLPAGIVLMPPQLAVMIMVVMQATSQRMQKTSHLFSTVQWHVI
jgi:hypothetical protein